MFISLFQERFNLILNDVYVMRLDIIRFIVFIYKYKKNAMYEVENININVSCI
jgi:hypothetical protein